MIVGLGYKARVGKDTAAQILVDKYGFSRLAFADRLKRVALDINPIVELDEDFGAPATPIRLQRVVEDEGWEGAKTIPEVRRLLQELGVAAREHLHANVWAHPVINEAVELERRGTNVVISDVRFPNEFDAVRHWGGTLIRIDRDAPAVREHVSENALADADWDQVVDNNGPLDDLELGLLKALAMEAMSP